MDSLPTELILEITKYLYEYQTNITKTCKRFKTLDLKIMLSLHHTPPLQVNYIYLDMEERFGFAQVTHEYLIELIKLKI